MIPVLKHLFASIINKNSTEVENDRTGYHKAAS